MKTYIKPELEEERINVNANLLNVSLEKKGETVNSGDTKGMFETSFDW